MEYSIYKIKEILCVEGFYSTSLGMSTSSVSTSSSSSISISSSSSRSSSSTSSVSSSSSISSSSVSSSSVSSSSVSSSSSPFPSVAFLGDSGNGPELDDEVAVVNAIKTKNPNLVFHLGDANYQNSDIVSDLQLKINTNFLNLWGSTWLSKMYIAYGNHDLDNSVDYGLHVANNLPLVKTAIGTTNLNTRKLCYDFVFQGIHFFVMNSGNTASGDGLDSTQDDKLQWQAQIDFIRPKIVASTATWKILVVHKAPWTNGTSHPSVTTTRLFGSNSHQSLGIDFVLSAHSHVYDHIIKNNVHYIVQGLGGTSKHGLSSTPQTGTVISYNQKYAYTILTKTTATCLDFTTYDVDGQIIESFQLCKTPSSSSSSSVSSSSSSSGVCTTCTSAEFITAAFPTSGTPNGINFHLLDTTPDYCTSPIEYSFTVDASRPADPTVGRYQTGCVEKIFALQNWQNLNGFKLKFNGFDAADKIHYYNYNFTTRVATPIGTLGTNDIIIGSGQNVELIIDYTTMSPPYPNAFYINKKPSGIAPDTNPVYKCTQWKTGLVANSCIPKPSSSSSSSSSSQASTSSSIGSTSSSSSSVSSSSTSSTIGNSYYTCAVADNPIECNVLNSGLYCSAAGDCSRWGGSEGTANNVSGSRTFVHVLEERFSSFSEIRGVIRQVAADVGACKVRISLRQWDRDGNLKTIFKGWEISSENSASSSSSSTLYNETGGTGSCEYNIDYEQDQTNAPSRTEISFNRTIDSCGFAGVGSVDKFGWQIEFINCSNSVVQYEFENEGYSICYSFLRNLAQACSESSNILDPNYGGRGGYVGAWAFFNTECCDPVSCGGTTFSCRGNAGSGLAGNTFNWVQYWIDILCTEPPICGDGSLYGCNDIIGGPGGTMNPLCKPYLRNHIWRPLQHTFIDTIDVGLCEIGAWPVHQDQDLCNPIILVFDWERFLTCSSDGNIPQRTERRGPGEANIKWLWDTNRILDKNLNPRSSSAQQLYAKLINQASPYWEMETDLYQEYSTCAAYQCSFASGYQSEGMFYNFWKDPDFNIKYYITFDINYLTTSPHYYDKLRLQQFPLNFNGNGERCKYDNGSYISYANIETNSIYLNDLKESGAGNSGVCKNDFIFYPNAMNNIDTINMDSRCDMGLVIKPTYAFFPWVINSFRINPDSIRIIEI